MKGEELNHKEHKCPYYRQSIHIQKTMQIRVGKTRYKDVQVMVRN